MWPGGVPRSPGKVGKPVSRQHLSTALLKCLFIILFQLHLPLLSARHHANLNMLGPSTLVQSIISEKREPSPQTFFSSGRASFFFFFLFTQLFHPPSVSLCRYGRAELSKDRREQREERMDWTEEKREGFFFFFFFYCCQYWLLNWFQSSSWTPGMFGTHTSRWAVFAFVGCRKCDLHPWSQPTSQASLPPRMKRGDRGGKWNHWYFRRKNKTIQVRMYKTEKGLLAITVIQQPQVCLYKCPIT